MSTISSLCNAGYVELLSWLGKDFPLGFPGVLFCFSNNTHTCIAGMNVMEDHTGERVSQMPVPMLCEGNKYGEYSSTVILQISVNDTSFLPSKFIGSSENTQNPLP